MLLVSFISHLGVKWCCPRAYSVTRMGRTGSEQTIITLPFTTRITKNHRDRFPLYYVLWWCLMLNIQLHYIVSPVIESLMQTLVCSSIQVLVVWKEWAEMDDVRFFQHIDFWIAWRKFYSWAIRNVHFRRIIY